MTGEGRGAARRATRRDLSYKMRVAWVGIL